MKKVLHKLPDGKEMVPVAIIKPHKEEKRNGIFIFAAFKPGQWATTRGTVHATNIPELQKGDEIEISPKCIRGNGAEPYRFDYEEEEYHAIPKNLIIYRIRNGEIGMVGEYNVVKPLKRLPKTSLIIPEHLKKDFQEGEVIYPSPALGLPKGTRVYYEISAQVPLEIDGENYYRQKNFDIVGWEEDGDIKMRSPWVLVKPDPDNERNRGGIIIPVSSKKRKSVFGTVVKTSIDEVSAGDRIIFSRSCSGITYKGEEYYLCHGDFDQEYQDIHAIIENGKENQLQQQAQGNS